MAYTLIGNYDGGPNNVYRLVIERNDESKGSFSGKFHDAGTNKWELVSGNYSFFSDGRDETVLTFKTQAGAWRWEADYLKGSPSFKTWFSVFTSNAGEKLETSFNLESNTPQRVTAE
ncbi:hypothetical protein IFT48_29915 [Pseudomonas fluorescens]|uniref:hypothetical protein n=1 Tax=Pseudomonas TaxID=286 RepID=UPI001905CED5|nr:MULTISPECIES: hypothetical protein [Pseudomonas]MBD8094215.1 hypothetical protein [Pseudomonas fluorescens]MBD8720225.1 hypothetical protein [Pseudomonas fluorescens]